MRPTQILSLVLLASSVTARATPRNDHDDHEDQLIVTIKTSKTTTICPTSTKTGNGQVHTSASWDMSGHYNATHSATGASNHPTHSTSWGSSSNHTQTYNSASSVSTSSSGSVSSTSSPVSTSATSTSQASTSATSTSPTSSAAPTQTPAPVCDVTEVQPNLIVNPSFEQDILGTGGHQSPWIIVGDGVILGPESTMIGAEDGEYRALLRSGSSDTSTLTQQFTGLIVGEKYTLYYYRERRGVDDGICDLRGCNLMVTVNGVGGLGTGGQDCNDGGYQRGDYTWIADTATAVLTFAWDCAGEGNRPPGGVIYIDNVDVHRNCTVEAVPEPDPEPACSSTSLPNPYLTGNGYTYLTSCGTFPVGEIIGDPIEGVDFEGCIYECDALHDTCVGLIYNSEVSSCALLNSISGYTDQENIDGAIVVMEIPAPDTP